MITIVGLLQSAAGQTSFKEAIRIAKQDTVRSLDEKLILLESLVDPAEARGDWDTVALLWHEVSVLYYQDGNYERAIDAGQKAESIRFSIGDTTEAIRSLFNLGVFHKSIGNFRVASRKFREIIDFGAGYDTMRLVYSYVWYAEMQEDLGNYHQAARVAQAGLPIAQEYNPILLGQLHWGLADAFVTLNLDSVIALRHYRIADSIFSAASDFSQVWDNAFNYTLALHQYGGYQEAITQYERLLHPSYPYSVSVEKQIDIHNNLALVHKDAGNLDDAMEQIGHARRLVSQLGDDATPEDRSMTANNYASVLEARGDFDAALSEFQNAIAFLLDFGHSGSGLENPALEDLIRSDAQVDLLTHLSDKGECLLKYADRSGDSEYYRASTATYRLADELLDHMRASQPTTGTRIFWRNQARAMYNNAVLASLRSGDMDGVRRFVDKSRGVLVQDALREFEAQSVLSEDLRERGDSLYQALAVVETRIYTAPDAADRQHAEEQRTEIQLAIDAHIEIVGQQHPGFQRIKYQRQTPSLQTLRASVLHDDVTLVSYTVIDSVVVAVLSGQGQDTAIVLTPPAGWEEDVRELVEMVAGSTIRVQRYGELAHEAYSWLIAPLPLSTRDLIIVPDGILARLSFDMLLTEPWDRERLTGAPYLIRQHRITYALSAQHVVEARSMTVKGQELLAIAPAFDGNEALAALPYAPEEAKSLMRYFKGEALIGQSAEVDALREAAGKYKAYHFATHAMLDEANMDFSRLEFADDPLYMPEIYTLRLPCEMVVLSACETAGGDYQDGTGIMSLARAFTIAGAQSVVPTLWKINDRAAGEIMTGFYDNLSEGHDKASALHQAKLAFLDDPAKKGHEKSPSHWAAFVSYGDTAPVTLTRAGSHWPLSALLSILLVGMLLVAWRPF